MDPVSPPQPPARGLLFYAGSAGLLTVMLIESAAVIGRHIGVPLLGALEIVQAGIVPAACAAMLIAALRGAHAAVHMVTERLPPLARRSAAGRGSGARRHLLPRTVRRLRVARRRILEFVRAN